MLVIADFSLYPAGQTSLVPIVAECQKVLSECKLEYRVHACGTSVEGPWDDVMNAIEKCHQAVHGMGVERIWASIRVETRTDKKVDLSTRLQNIERLTQQQTTPGGGINENRFSALQEAGGGQAVSLGEEGLSSGRILGHQSHPESLGLQRRKETFSPGARPSIIEGIQSGQQQGQVYGQSQQSVQEKLRLNEQGSQLAEEGRQLDEKGKQLSQLGSQLKQHSGSSIQEQQQQLSEKNQKQGARGGRSGILGQIGREDTLGQEERGQEERGPVRFTMGQFDLQAKEGDVIKEHQQEGLASGTQSCECGASICNCPQ